MSGRAAGVEDGDLGINCPVCGEWNYIGRAVMTDGRFGWECDNEDCSAPLVVVASLTAIPAPEPE